MSNPSCIFVLDDDAIVADALRTILECWGYAVAVAHNCGPASADFARLKEAERPDLILADYFLAEDRTGLDAISELREVHGTDIPGLLLTGDASVVPASLLHRLQVRILNKPVDSKVLKSALHDLLGG
ncbi:hypothetical protein JCM17960_27830 [Magnetospira thiophila]